MVQPVPDSASFMPAAVYRGQRTVAVEKVPVPDAGPEEVLVEVSHCGICGSDLHMVLEGWGAPGSISGHEYSGIVARVGSRVEGWAPGDRVVGGPSRGCGRCDPCRAGRANLCAVRPKSGVDPFVGAFARYKVAGSSALYRIPDELDLRTAALTEPLAVAVHGVRRVGPRPSGRALVTGAGPIGLLTVAVLRAAGVRRITVSEPGRKRKVLARKVGATEVIDPERLAVPALPMDVVDHPYQMAFECSGRPEAMELAAANLDRGSTLVLLGTGMERPKFDPNRIILNELVVTGAVEYTPEDYTAALDLLATGRVPAEVLIEPEDQPLDRLQWAMEQLGHGELAGKVLVVPGA